MAGAYSLIGMKLWTVALALILVGLIAPPAHAQVLQQVEQQVAGSGPSGSSSDSRGQARPADDSHRGGMSSDGTDDDSDGDLSCLGAYLGFRLITFPYWLPVDRLADDLSTGYFLRYPY